MPLLSRLFGRKQHDDDKSPSAEGPLGAQPLGDQSVGATPLVPDESPADDAAVEPGSKPLLSEAREEDATDDDGPESAAEPLAAVALPENEPAQAPSLPNGEEGDSAFGSQGIPPETGEGLPAVLGTGDNHDVSSNGSVAVLETTPDRFSLRENESADNMDRAVGEGSEPFGTLSKESADAFVASIEPVGARPLETSDPFAAPEATPNAPFNALAAASADAFEMPIEKIADPFGTPPKEFPEPLAQKSSAPAGTLFKSQATRSNPFMKLVAEADEEAHTLIGGKEDDLVPLIPDTEADEADEAATDEIDESGIAEAAVTSLKGACDFLVVRVKKLSAQQDGTRVVAGLIALVGELDARYALDMGIRRRNGVEELLIDVRGRMAEGDRFVLESLENGRGGLTADAFLRDLKTIAPSDHPRMLGHYVVILTFMIKHVLHQYLRSLEEDQTRTYEISYHLDYLVEGVRDMLMSKVTAGAS